VVTGSVKEIPDDLIGKIKDIEKALYETPLLGSVALHLTRWMSEYYLCSWGEAIFNALPAMPKRPADLAPREPAPLKCEFSKTLTQAQQRALSVFHEKKDDGKPFLIHGVAGSGKTEVYLRLAREVLERGKSVIYLVPEISLISQIRLFVEECFPGQAVYFHSKQTAKERWEGWCELKRGAKRLVVGARSALFAPLKDVGLIVMDEEHDDSYKQDETPRYHTLKTALKRAELEKAHLLLGSATPSLESLELVKEGRAHLIRMNDRISGREACHVHLVDLKRNKRSNSPCLSDRLHEKIRDRLEKKEGVLIFLNRRGHSTQVKCPSCGFFYLCPHCDVALTWHQEAGRLICHYCRHAVKPASRCPECSKPLSYSGFGTEKIESELSRLFPEARIERLDRETVQSRGNLEKVLQEFRDQKIDILVGTQMLSKGLDFKHLTLVGVLMAEGNLQLPDFRAAERTYQLLEQVSGRSGRGEAAGEVVLQTYLPDHYSVRAVVEKSPAMYIEKELEHRKDYGYPPFKQMINLTLRGRKEEAVIKNAESLAADIERIASQDGARAEVLGPAPLPFYRLRGYFRWHIMIKGDDLTGFKEKLSDHLDKKRKAPEIYLEIDVDPASIL
jgi:primosomal protein N' (replication factor Y)